MNENAALVGEARSGGASGAEAAGGPRDVPTPGRRVPRLGRGLEDVSHLFLSRVPAPGQFRDETQDHPGVESPRLQPAVTPAAGLAPSAANGDRLVSLICKSVGGLEDGLRVVDANLRLDVGGTVDLVAVDRCNRIVIIDVDAAASDTLLLRGICHLDWFARNVAIARRMYSGCRIDFASEPRAFLLAPRFSPVVLCAVRRVAPLRITCVTYSTTPPVAWTGIHFNQI